MKNLNLTETENLPVSEEKINLHSYDHYIIAFSGGKDSVACFLHLLKEGVPLHKIELWHHCIDGREGSTLMDWPVTEDYCQKFADAFGVKIYFSWKEGGFEREMLKDKARTAPNHWEMPDPEDNDNIIECSKGGVRGGLKTRLQFPQVTANLSQRWCSAYLKIDVCTMAVNNQERFINKRTLVITGERAEESAARSKYKTFEPDRSDRRNGTRVVRHVDHWRPVHKWLEAEVWNIIAEYKVNPHIAYRLGWNRLSCISCIFGSPNQWASLNQIAPDHVTKISDYEKKFGKTIHRKLSVDEQVAKGVAYANLDPELSRQGLGKSYTDPIFVETWNLPAGAYGENAGPC